MIKTLIALFFLIPCLACFAQQPYVPVDAESKIHFIIKNFAIKTGGDFTGLRGTIHFDPARLSTSKFEVSVNAATVDTDSETRDRHLKGGDYFDIAKYPTINFNSTGITPAATAGLYHLQGNLTIKGITKSIQFDFSATAQARGYLFEGEFEIDRLDFNVGGKSISMQDKVKIELKVVARK